MLCKKLKGIVVFPAVLCVVLVMGCGKGPEDESRKESTREAVNKPPLIKTAEIRPDRPTVQQDLSVIVRASDPEGDPVTLSYQWVINGREVADATGDTLSKELFQKGDEVRCVIYAADDQTEGEPVVTEPVLVRNALPVIDDIKIEPEMLVPDGEARVVVEAHDPDEDPLSFSYEWYVNDELVERDSETCSLAGLTESDKISVKVAVSDGQVQNQWAQSRIVEIANRPPQIVSDPPSTWDPAQGFQYAVKVMDPEGDAFQVRIEGELPPGAVWDEEAATLTWMPPAGIGDSVFPLKIVAEDEDGGAFSQEFTLSLRQKEGAE